MPLVNGGRGSRSCTDGVGDRLTAVSRKVVWETGACARFFARLR